MAAKIRGITIERRGKGRPTKVEERITRTLVDNAATMRDWQIENGRVATGKSIRSYKVVTERQTDLLRVFDDIAEQTGKTQRTESGRKANTQLRQTLRRTNLGLVNGQIMVAPHTIYALRGRGPGKMPPIAEIRKWINAKRIKSSYSKDQLAFLIARKIGREGTNPPHFTERLDTELTSANFKLLAKSIAPMVARKIGNIHARTLIVMIGDMLESRDDKAAFQLKLKDIFTSINEWNEED